MKIGQESRKLREYSIHMMLTILYFSTGCGNLHDNMIFVRKERMDGDDLVERCIVHKVQGL